VCARTNCKRSRESAPDHHHVIPYAHYSTFAACLDSIHILYQHVPTCTVAGAPFPLTSAIPADLSAVETPVARPVSLAALAAVHPVLWPQAKQLALGLSTVFCRRAKP